MTNIDIQVGQIWKSKRCLNPPRYVVVDTVSEEKVQCRDVATGHRTNFLRRRMKPGCGEYELVTDSKLLMQLRGVAQAKGVPMPPKPSSESKASPSHERKITDATPDRSERCQHILHAIKHLLSALELCGFQIKVQP